MATIRPYAIDIAVTKVSKPAVITSVWSERSWSTLLKPALPGTSMRTPGTTKTGRAAQPHPDEATGDTDRDGCDEDGGLVSEQPRSDLVPGDGEARGGAHHERVGGAGSQGDGERERREERRRAASPSQAGDGAGPDLAEPVGGDRLADRDAGREPEELDECARRVGDTGLEVLGRQQLASRS